MQGYALAQTDIAPPWDDENPQGVVDADPPIDPKPLTLEDLKSLPGFEDAVPSDFSQPVTQAPLTPLEQAYATRLGSPLALFGYDVFEKDLKLSMKQTLPTGKVNDSYVLSTGDTLDVIFRGQENARKPYLIDTQGMLIVETLSPIQAAGKTLGDLKILLQEDAKRLHNLNIHVSLAGARQIDVLVIGNVRDPGRKTLTPFHSVLDALNFAGGIRPDGSLRRIKLVRAGTSTLIDLYSIILQDGGQSDITLQDGDRLIIPPIGPTMAIAGAVKRPAIYELKQGESLSTLQALGLSGGVLSPGSNRFTRLSLLNTGDEEVENIKDPSRKMLSDGAILKVSQAKERRARNVTLVGAVRDPGDYDLETIQNLSDLIGKNHVLDESVYPLIGILERRDPSLLTRSFIEFSPARLMAGHDDIPLKEGDIVHLFSKDQIRSLHDPDQEKLLQTVSFNHQSDNLLSSDIISFLKERIAFVRGAVRVPGPYPVADQTDLNILISAAGGPTREADTQNIEITTRMIPVDEAHEAMAPNRLTVALNSSAISPVLISAGDTVRINQTFNRVEEQSVTLLGEVKNPGKYDLMPGDTMQTLLQRAGGLTDIAYADGVIFSRASERKQEETRYKAQAQDLELKLASLLQQKDDDQKPDMDQIATIRALVTQLKTARAIGRITVEADPSILSQDPEQDILLESGDKIFIPRRPLTVRVGGEVLSPASLQFRKGKSADTYIDEAGGPTYFADLDRAFVVYPDGSAQPLSISAWKQRITMIPPGSTIIVPRDPKPYDFLESAEQITQILANIALTGFYVDDLGDDN